MVRFTFRHARYGGSTLDLIPSYYYPYPIFSDLVFSEIVLIARILKNVWIYGVCKSISELVPGHSSQSLAGLRIM